MSAAEVWSGSGSGAEPKTIWTQLQRYGVHLFLISFACVYYLSNASVLLVHYDLGWHLAAGDLIREHGRIPFQDPWSFTLGDRQWYNLSWLWDVLASVLFQATGFGGLVLVSVACGAVIVGYLASVCLSFGASTIAVCASVLLACLIYPSFTTTPNIYLAVSPNTVTMLFGVIFYGECLRRTRRFLLPLMMVFWANLHGGFLIAFPIIGIFAATALLRRDWIDFRSYTLTGIGCFVAIFVNPLGWHIYDGLTATLGHFVQASITEWQSYYLNASLPGCIPGLLYMSLFAGLELSYRGNNPAPLEARLLSWLLLFLGLAQFRYMSFFFLFSAVPLALHLDRLLPERVRQLDVRKSLFAAGIMGLCALPPIFVRAEPTLGLSDLLTDRDADYLKTHLSHARLLNHWNVGGLLIFRTHGTVPVFIDGRAATAYPDPLLRDYFKLANWEIDEGAWDMVLEKYRIDALLWPRDHEPLRRFLVDKRGWKEEYTGRHETIYVKP